MYTVESEGIKVELSKEAANKVIHQMNVDEIFDAVNQMIKDRRLTKTEVISRFGADHKEQFIPLLKEFWSNSDRHPALNHGEVAVQLELWEDFILDRW